MSTREPPIDTSDVEVSRLIALLHETGRQLEELTGGQIDSVLDSRGRTFLLQHAQDQIRQHEATRQASVLKALPANIAVIDGNGVIVSVNDAWREFGEANGLNSPGGGIGSNYLAVCDAVRGHLAPEAQCAAAGIRSVLARRETAFSMKYACHSPRENRWFLMRASPVFAPHSTGAAIMHLDISGEKRIEEDLVVSEGRFRQLAENISDVFFLRDASGGHMLYVSPAYETIWCRTCESLYADPRSWIESIHPDDKEEIAERSAQQRLPGNFEFRYRIVRPDGSVRWIDTKGAPVMDKQGQVIRIAGIATDITDDMLRQSALQRSESELRILSDQLVAERSRLLEAQRVAKVGSWETDVAAGTVLWSDETHRIFETDPLEFHPTHESFLLFVHPAEREVVKAAFAASLNETAACSIEHRLMLPNGTVKHVEERWQPYFDYGKFSVRAIGTCQDITGRKHVAIALQKSEEEFRTLAESMPQIVWITRSDGWITYFNRHWMAYTGLSIDESLGEGWIKPLHPEDRQSAWNTWRKAISGGDAFSIECRLRREDGAYRWWLLRGSPQSDGAGNIGKWFGTCTDIHDLKSAEEEILRSNSELRTSEMGVKRLNRVHAVLSGINALIVHVRDKQALFLNACELVVSEGGFRMAMIVLVDPETQLLSVAASAGKDTGLLAAIKDTLSSADRAPKTMIARAIAEKHPLVSNRSQTDPRLLFGKAYIEAGVRSLAVLPLMVGESPVGVLALYSEEDEFFHAEEISLLAGLADDVAFAIDFIDKRERLDYLAYYDVLTGLANRNRFNEQLEQLFDGAAVPVRRVGLVLVDISHFKTINDTYGRTAGDKLLKDIAARMASRTGDSSRLARIDADHFAIMVPDFGTIEDLTKRIEVRIHEVFNPSFRIANANLRISAKFGIAMYPDDGVDSEVLFRNAEAALKQAKTAGEKYLFYAQSMNERVAEKLLLENKLRSAIENEEFVLHYQPKTSLTTGRITGAEALIRWNDPESGLVPPGRFIPILEETGLIFEVGRWALRRAIADFLRWRSAGLPAVRIAVNVSPLQLRRRDFIAEVRDAIGVGADAASGLELEITESLIMEDVLHSTSSLEAIRAMGVTIAIDDFGTGFSSLSYLAKLPVDVLKIDRSFVMEMTVGPQGLALVSTIINLAHSLKLKVVAEGVETEEQSRLLRLLGCDQMRGYLFSRPVPAEDFESAFLSLGKPAG